MTATLDPDRSAQKQPMLPFNPADVDRCGIRLNRAEFSRFLGVSKQAVSDWVRAGKLTLGADGLLDPRQGVAQLMRTTDPARLRSKVLAPLVRDVGTLQRRVVDLEVQLAAEREDAKFHEAVSLEFMAQLDALHRHLLDEWCDLRLLPAPQALAALVAWIGESEEAGGDPDIQIMDCVSDPEVDSGGSAPHPDEGGAG